MSAWKQKAHLLLLMIFVGVPLAGEAALRVAIHQHNPQFRNPSLYADALSDDDYWKLHKKWNKRSIPTHDETLGWRTLRSPKNPLGILRAEGYEPQVENTVLCFGDSFTAGTVPLGKRIPDYMDQRLAGRVAYNYGVGGYGVGQMYLSYLEHAPAFVDPVIVVAIYLRDLDRTILNNRGAPKPRYRVEDGELTLTEVPIAKARWKWYLENPPEIRSFFLAWVTRGLWELTVEGRPLDSDYRSQEKMEVNRAIIEALVDDARSKNLRLLFVTYPSPHFIGSQSWRTPFLSQVFSDLEVPWVNGEEVIQADMQTTGLGPTAYFKKDNHPNPMANSVFADAILESLDSLWDIPARLKESPPVRPIVQAPPLALNPPPGSSD